jgi:hypothetical protein
VKLAYLALPAVSAALIAVAPPSHASEPRDCKSWESGVQIAMRAGNGQFKAQYRLEIARGRSEMTAQQQAREYARMAFWRSLRIQTNAILDWSDDPELFLPMFFFAKARSETEMLREYQNAMALCGASTASDWPTMRLIP